MKEREKPMRVAVVTGVARCAGIGHAVCSALLDSGLAVIGIDKYPLENTSPLKGNPWFIPTVAPVTNHQQIRRAVKSGLRYIKDSTAVNGEVGQLPPLSVVVNNAGNPNPFMKNEPLSSGAAQLSEKEFDDTIAVRLQEFDSYLQTNLRGAFLVTEVCRAFFPLDGDVSIIHIGSTRAHQSEFGPIVGQEGYASAKSGLLGLMHAQGQRQEKPGPRVRVNVISPGWINTDDTYVPTKNDDAWHAAGRVGRPGDVATLVAFLADGEKSGFITCQEFVIDGGATKRMYYPE